MKGRRAKLRRPITQVGRLPPVTDDEISHPPDPGVEWEHDVHVARLRKETTYSAEEHEWG